MKNPRYISKKIPFYKKKQFFTIIIGVFFIMLMALSAVDIGSPDNDQQQNTVEYNGIEFASTDLGWQAHTSKGVIQMIYSPNQVSDLELEKVDLNVLNKPKVYLSVDPTQAVDLALRDFQINFPFKTTQFSLSCFEDSEGCEEIPLKTCDDVNLQTGVVVFKESEVDKITLENDCLTVEGKDLLKVVDKLLLDYYV
jgi:hypothetical protein